MRADRRTLAIAFTATAVLVMVVQLPFTHANAWHYFDEASRLLVGAMAQPGPQGLTLYGSHPEFQFGPISILAAAPFVLLGPTFGDIAAIVAMSGVGVWATLLLVRVAARLRPDADPRLFRRAALVAGVTFIVTWGDVAVRTAHIDDALALAATVVAVDAVSVRRPWKAALALGVAGAAKPWAVVFAPMVIAAGGGLLHLAVAAGIVVATWAPFLLAEPATLEAARHGIANEASSALRAMGVHDATTPEWVRPAQIALGLGATLYLVARRRWVEVVMTGVAIRLLLDPAANRYYTVGLVLGLALHELVVRPERLPWLTLLAAIALEVPQAQGFPPTIAGWIRIAVVAVVLIEAWRATRTDAFTMGPADSRPAPIT